MDGFVAASMEWNHHNKDLQSKPPDVSVVQSKQSTIGKASLSRTTYRSENSPQRLRSLHVLGHSTFSKHKIVTSRSSCHGLFTTGDGTSTVHNKERLLPRGTRKRREHANRALKAIKCQATDDEGCTSGVIRKGISYMLNERDTDDKENAFPEGDENDDKDDNGDGNKFTDMGRSDINDASVLDGNQLPEGGDCGHCETTDFVGEVIDNTLDDDDNPMPVEDVLDTQADRYVGMELRQRTSAIETAENRLQLVNELNDTEVSNARLYRFPEQLDVKQGELVCFVKFGCMMFSTYQNNYKVLKKELYRLFAKPKPLQLKCPLKCDQLFDDVTSLCCHICSGCPNTQSEIYQRWNAHVPVAFFVNDEALTILKNTKTDRQHPMDLLNPWAFPCSATGSAKHKWFNLSRETKKERDISKGIKADIAKVVKSKQAFLHEKEYKRAAQVEKSLPTLLSMPFLKEYKDWPDSVPDSVPDSWGKKNDDTPDDDDNPMPVEDVLDRRADRYVGMELGSRPLP